MIAHVLTTVRAAGFAGPIVVSRPKDERLKALLGKAKVDQIDAADHVQGMGHSLAVAVRAVPADWRGVFILLADMPFVAPALLTAMAHHLTDSGIIIPTHQGVRGNPVLWGCAHFEALAALSGDIGGRVLWHDRAAHIHEHAWHDASIFADIDTPSQYRERSTWC